MTLYVYSVITAKFQADVVTHSLYKGIVEAMNKHTSNEILIEVALEIFIILSLNGKCSMYHVAF